MKDQTIQSKNVFVTVALFMSEHEYKQKDKKVSLNNKKVSEKPKTNMEKNKKLNNSIDTEN